MSQKKYVSLSKLESFLNNLRNTFATLSHKHTISDITDYVIDSDLSSTSTNPVQNKVIDSEFEAVSVAMNVLEQSIDGKADSDHTHTYESIEGLKDVIGEIADSKFYVVTFDIGDDNKYHGDLTFAEIREKFEAGGNMVARIDGTDYIPLLSAATHQIIFSGIYQSQSVALTINSSDVCTLTTTRLADGTSLSSHTANTNNPHKVTCEQIGAATTNEVTNAIDTCKTYTDTTVTTLKNELLNGAGEAYDTLKELGDLIDTNVDAIGALETIAAGKADATHTHDDLYYTKAEIDESLLQKSQVQMITWEADD